MSKKEVPIVSINQAKIIYIMNDSNISTFNVGDFGTDLDTFQHVVAAIEDLVDKGMITVGQYHQEQTSGDRKIDLIHRCKLTERGLQEIDRLTGAFLNSEGEFDLQKWQ